MSLRVVLVVASFGALAAVAACTLNPQPLPPGDPDTATGPSSSSGGFAGGGSRSDEGENADSTNSPPSPISEGGAPKGDAATDATEDAGADAADAGTD